MNTTTNEIRELISDNRLDEAISHMKGMTQDQDLAQSLTLIQSNITKFSLSMLRGTLTHSENRLQRSRLVHTLLDVLMQIDQRSRERNTLPTVEKALVQAPVLSLFHIDKDRPEAEVFAKFLRSLTRNEHLKEVRQIEFTDSFSDQELNSQVEEHSPQIAIMLVSKDSLRRMIHLFLHRNIGSKSPTYQLILVPIDVRMNKTALDSEVELNDFHILPKNQKPIAEWSITDEAWLSVIKGLKEFIKEKFGSTSTMTE